MLKAGTIQTLVGALPEAANWAELVDVLQFTDNISRPDWLLPIKACVAVGGQEENAQYVASAIACLQLSIKLVDDILDDDPNGPHRELGAGQVANLALGLQSAAIRIVTLNQQGTGLAGTLSNIIARIALETAAGQNMDVQNLAGEDDYWAVVKAKSTPFYGGALEIGGLVGGASTKTANDLHELGVLIGEMIQIEDDLQDAFQVPANADWIQGRNNLPILYARTAEHEEKGQLESLILEIDNRSKLKAAQQILIRSGAASYCLYLLVERYRDARSLLLDMDLRDASPLMRILDDYAESLISLLEVSGVQVSKSVLVGV